MQINIKKNQIREILKDFYEVTGLRIGLFGLDGIEFASYPENLSKFCSLVKMTKEGFKDCDACDMNAFSTAEKTGELYVYNCHMNLTEAVLPIMYEGVILAYLMFGQVIDGSMAKPNLDFDRQINKLIEKEQEKRQDNPEYNLQENLQENLQNNLKDNLKDNQQNNLQNDSQDQQRALLVRNMKMALGEIKEMTHEKIIAAAKMMSILSSYIKFSDLIYTYTGGDATLIKSYIEQNIENPLSIEIICKKIGIGKTCACKKFKESYNMTINYFITTTRINKAITLLRAKDISINEISCACGYEDYNYFIRVFKKYTGVSPLVYKKNERKTSN